MSTFSLSFFAAIYIIRCKNIQKWLLAFLPRAILCAYYPLLGQHKDVILEFCHYFFVAAVNLLQDIPPFIYNFRETSFYITFM